MSPLKSKAILLISGAGDSESLAATKNVLTSTLSPFTLNVDDIQSIEMGGRIILAVQISCDEAHLPAIESDLRTALAPFSLDIAAELI